MVSFRGLYNLYLYLILIKWYEGTFKLLHGTIFHSFEERKLLKLPHMIPYLPALPIYLATYIRNIEESYQFYCIVAVVEL